MYLIMGEGSHNNAPQDPQADRGGTSTTAPSAAPKSLNGATAAGPLTSLWVMHLPP